jgi:uncharacterized membrane protein YjjP (DUF1212 family)
MDEPSAPLSDVSRAVAALGTALLGVGASSYRVERAMQRACDALGCERVTTLVTLRTMVVTVESDGRTATESAQAAALHVNADRLDELERLVRHLSPGTTPAELTAAVESVVTRPAHYSKGTVTLAVGLACAGFAGLSGGGIVEMLAAFVGAAAGQALRGWALGRGFNPFLVVAVVAAAASGTYLAMVTLLQTVEVASRSNEAGLVSAVLFLVPGFPLVTGTLDLLRNHVEAGLSRLTYASTVLAMAALGLLAVTAVGDPSPAGPRVDVVAGGGWALAVGLTALSAAGFAVLFNLAPRLLALTGVIGSVGNVVRLALVESGATTALAAFVGALVVGLLVAALSGRLHFSRIVVAIPAVIPMVPGSAAYTALLELSQARILPALASGVEAALIVGGIALGLAVARILTDREWAFVS